MTRHARNCTAGAVYTYHERQKDTKQSGWGSKDVRLGKDSIRNFDCCCLTLQPCKDPVVTPDGFLYDKEAILKNILHQKKLIARRLKEFEKQQKKDERELAELARAEQESKLQKFCEKEDAIVSKPLDPFKKPDMPSASPSTSTSLNNMEGAKAKALPSFWIPSLTPKAEATVAKKPDEKVRCPMSGKPLKMSHLIDVKFTPINDRDDKKSIHVKDARYVCAVTNDVLGNTIPAAVLRTSGCVVTIDCVEKLLKKDMLDPINTKKMTDKDIIPLQKGATGFSDGGVDLKAKIHGAAIMT